MRLLVLAVLTACSSSPKEEAASPPPAADGAQVYAMACARCHGAKGLGDGERAAVIGVIPKLNRALPTDYVRVIVTEGKGAMPPHKDRLSKADIDAVVQYVQQLSGEP